MRTFLIFAAVLTFAYVIYYCVMILTDLLKDKGKNATSSEVIRVPEGHDDAARDAGGELPVYVEEFKDGSYGINDGGVETVVNTNGETHTMDADDREAIIAKAESECSPIAPDIDGAISSDEFDEELLALNKRLNLFTYNIPEEY